MKKLIFVFAALVIATSAQANLLQNGDFEQGNTSQIPPSWTNVVLGPAYKPTLTGNAVPPSSNYHAEHICWNGDPDAGYIYQQVFVSPGNVLTAAVDYVWYSGASDPDNWHVFGIGIDPTGGTDWNAGTVAKTMAPACVKSTWNYGLTVTGVASSGLTTVFLYSECTTDNNSWWAHAFDGAQLTAENAPEPCGVLALSAGLLGLVGGSRRRRA